MIGTHNIKSFLIEKVRNNSTIKYKKNMRDKEFISYEGGGFILLDKKFKFNPSKIKMVEHKKINEEFIIQLEICVESSKERINNEEIFEGLMAEIEFLSVPPTPLFDWNLNILQTNNEERI